MVAVSGGLGNPTPHHGAADIASNPTRRLLENSRAVGACASRAEDTAAAVTPRYPPTTPRRTGTPNVLDG